MEKIDKPTARGVYVRRLRYHCTVTRRPALYLDLKLIEHGSTVNLEKKSVMWRSDMLPACLPACRPPSSPSAARRPRPTNSTRNSLYINCGSGVAARQAASAAQHSAAASALSVSLLPGQANHSRKGKSAARFLRIGQIRVAIIPLRTPSTSTFFLGV